MTSNPAVGAPSGVPVGSPVTGDEFFDRDTELAELTGLLRLGASVLITAPRRIGKTSLLLELANRLGDEGAFLFVDVQSRTTEADAVLKLAETAAQHHDLRHVVADAFRNVLGTLFSRLDEVTLSELSVKLRDGIAPDWRSKADEILERLARAEKPVVVAFDELPILVSALLCGDDRRMTPERVERTRVFLSWLREATIRHRRELRFIVSGSIGLEPLLTRAGISETMTTFTPLEVSPWDQTTARRFVEDRTRRAGVAMSDGAADRLLERIACFIPHHVAMFVHFVLQDSRRRGATKCSPADVDRIYHEQMLSVHGHVELATYEDRLRRVVAPETLGAALELLTEAAVVGRLTQAAASAVLQAQGLVGRDAAETLRFLLGVFVHDGYLKRRGDDFVFVSNLLRDWWSRRFSLGYVRVDER